MWIKIKDLSGEHLIQTSFDVAVGGDPEYAFMNEWDIQRIRAYCRERSLTLEENVGALPQEVITEQIDKVQELTDIAIMELGKLKMEKSTEDNMVTESSLNKNQIRGIIEAIAPYVEIIEED